MQLRESIHKTKKFFHNTLHNLKSILLGGYQKLTKPTSFNPFSCGRSNVKNYQTDQYYADFCNEWEYDLEKAMNRKSNSFMGSKEPMRDEDMSNESEMKLAKSPLKKKQGGGKEENSKKISQLKKADEKSSKNTNESGYVLANKMKELEMMDVSDVEHVLDVEEALHYYSRLKSPVYLDIVDKFFTNMYTEFSVPQASASINSSKRRLGSISRTWPVDPVKTLRFESFIIARAKSWRNKEMSEAYARTQIPAIFIPGSSIKDSSESSKEADEGADDDGGKGIEPLEEGDEGADDDGGKGIEPLEEGDEGADDDGGKGIEPFKEGDGADDDDDGEPLISADPDDEDGDPLQESEGAVDGDLVPSKEVDGAGDGGVALKEGEGKGEGGAPIDELLLVHLDLNRLRNPVSRDGSGLLVLPKS
ncbi:unnamed protein product [Dovyalis caffra]|uniref:Uncharacterized protein n=1 Tax=Dovyalis caffra TaxID=77055 RepID=A0AAV1SV29_9ROSI|nr:unnamed protein product [Dovyalis caffra]